MRLAAPTHPRQDLCACICQIHADGFAGVDLFLEPDQADPALIDPLEVRACLRGTGLPAVGHTAWYIPYASEMKSLRDASREILRRAFEVFSVLEVRLVTVHANWPHGLFSADEGIALQLEALSDLDRDAEDLGVCIMYEPLGSAHDTPEALDSILAALPRIGCHLDLGHCNLHGRDPVSMIRRFSKRLCHLHLHDNNGRDDLHLPPGAGGMKWDEIYATLAEIRYDQMITLEVFSPEREYLRLARRLVTEGLARHGLQVEGAQG